MGLLCIVVLREVATFVSDTHTKTYGTQSQRGEKKSFIGINIYAL